MDKHHRFEFLDGLRGIAALVVVIFHFTDQYNHSPLFSSAPLAVDLFFCLSGFVIAWSYSQRLIDGMTYFSYFKRRLIRLYPMFLMGLFVGLIAYFVKLKFGHTPYSIIQILKSNFLNIFYLPYFVGHLPGTVHGVFLTNPPSWSLFFEMVANIAFLVAVRLSKSLLIVIVGILAIWLVFESYYFKDWPGWSTYNFIGGFPRVGFSFMVGVLTHRFYYLVNKLPAINPLILVVTLLLMFVLPFYKSLIYWLFCVLFVVPIFVIFGAKVEIKTPVITKLVLFLGWISYPIYCLHNPILNIYKGVRYQPENFYIEISLVFILTIIFTYIIAKFYDEPVRAWLNKRFVLQN